MLFYLLLSGGPKIPKIKVSNSKVSYSKVSYSKVSYSKVSNSLLTFHRTESNCLLRDFLVSFCETLLCVERLACIFEIFGPLHIISHERRRKQTTTHGLSAGLRCRVSCFPVWCDERRPAQTSADQRRRQVVVCPPVYAAGLAISPCGPGHVASSSKSKLLTLCDNLHPRCRANEHLSSHHATSAHPAAVV
jgi:hypothetical protein